MVICALAQTAVVAVSRHAADAVAAHFGLGAVGVEHAHTHIRDFGRQDENHAVAAHGKPPRAQFHGQRAQIAGQGFLKTVDVDVIVAEPVHFGEVKHA